MKTSTKIYFIFLMVFAGVLLVSEADFALAGSTCGQTRVPAPNNSTAISNVLRIEALGQTVDSSSLNTLSLRLTNISSTTKSYTYQKWSCRCDKTGLSACVAYWSGGAGITASDGFGGTEHGYYCQETEETTTLSAGESRVITLSVSQYNNQYCGTFQLDFKLMKIDGVAVSSTLAVNATNSYYNNILAASVADLCTTCSVATPTCFSNSDCGTNGYVGDLFCQNGNVYRNYRTYVCNNAGTSTSSCSNSIEARLQQTCSTSQTCSNGSCVQEDEGDCDSNSDCGANGYTGSEFCWNGDVYRNYRTYTCHNAGTSNSYCSNNTEKQLTDNCNSNEVCNNGNCEDDDDNDNCGTHNYKQCYGNYLYWYDSCGTREDIYQYCENGCSGNTCQNNCTSNCNNNNNCVNFSYKQCVGNNIYWYNSCGQQTDLYQTCYGSNTCQAGACVTTQPIQPTYISHYRTSCYGNSVYWYDSLGRLNSVYKNCVDANSCTIDTCSGSACANTLKCDGTTCATSSADYNTYCKSGQGTGASNILFSLFAKKDANAVQWDKSVEIRSNETSYFLITVENNSEENIPSAIVLASIPSEITSLGNLKVNDVAVSGDIVSGIEIGPLASGVLKRITFEGKSGTISFPSTKQVNAKVDFNGISQPDILSINFSTAQVAGAVSEAKSSIWIVEFLKRWYLWILGLLVLIFLFVVIFRRLSSNQ